MFIDHIEVLLARLDADPEEELRRFLRRVQPDAVARRASVVITTRLSFARDGWRQPMRAAYGATLRPVAALRLFVTANPLENITAFGPYRRASNANTAGDWVRVEAWGGQRNPVVRSSDCIAPYTTKDSEEAR